MKLEQAEDYKGTQLGWITGFVWTRLQIIDYKAYSEVFHGEVSKELVPVILRKFKQTKKFGEHIRLQVLKFILALALIASVLMFISSFFTGSGLLFNVSITLFFILIMVKEIEECMGCFGNLQLRSKIRTLLAELNRQLEPVGIMLRFPTSGRRFLFLFQWNIFNSIDYSTIEIWSTGEMLEPLSAPAQSQPKQKLGEDESVYV